MATKSANRTERRLEFVRLWLESALAIGSISLARGGENVAVLGNYFKNAVTAAWYIGDRVEA